MQEPAASCVKPRVNQKNQRLNCLTEKLERELILNLAGFPDMFIEATEYLKPNMIADYTNALSRQIQHLLQCLPSDKS